MKNSKPPVKRRAPNGTRQKREVADPSPETQSSAPSSRAATWSIEGVRAMRKRTQDALKSTEFTTHEACIVEWLLSDFSPGSRQFRARFSHAICNASDDQLAMAKGLISDVLFAITSNSSEGLAHVESLALRSYSLDTQSGRIKQALRLLSEALKRGSVGHSPEQVARLCFMLRPCDERFCSLDADAAHEVLKRTSASGRGGRGKLGVPKALAMLAAQCNAFDAASLPLPNFERSVETVWLGVNK